MPVQQQIGVDPSPVSCLGPAAASGNTVAAFLKDLFSPGINSICGWGLKK